MSLKQDIKGPDLNKEEDALDSPTPNVEEVSSHKRIAKNTIFLYFRMMITMVIGLFTSRVVLNTLGVEDYGINNVVGGVVGMFSLISGSISGSIGRFITFELGTGNKEKLKRVFSTSVTIQIILAIVVVIIAEIVGIWFLNNELQINPDRMVAAHWVFHCSLITFAISLISLPYNACIVAHERMNVFAYISILEVVLKLVIVYMLLISPFDKLETYAVLGVCVAVLIRLIYGWYCKRQFEECTYNFILDKTLFKQMFGFAGWQLVGTSAAILRGQGSDILINIFTRTTVVNAAAGIAATLTGVISGFVGNFTAAFTPQITKLYAAQKFDDLIKLIYMGAKFAPYLMLFLAVPIFFNARFILQLWLGQVPEHTVNFVLITILYMFNELMAQPLIHAKNANGKIRNYQIVVGGVLLLTLPIAYVALKLGAPVEAVFIAKLATSVMAMLVRLYMLRGDLPGLSISHFLRNVYLRVIFVALIAAILPALSYIYIPNEIVQFISTSIIAIISVAISVYFIGCTKTEQLQLKSQAQKIILKFKR